MNETFRTIFSLDKQTLLLLLKELCKSKIVFDDVFGKNPKITKELVNDVPESLKISSWGTILIDSTGINYKGEHSYENQNIAIFNEFFDLNTFLDSLEEEPDDFFISDEPTQRGFSKIEFRERNGVICSIQKSSIADDDCIWFGANDLGVKEFKSGSGWKDRVDLDVHTMEHHFSGNNRMHLTLDMVEKLLPILEHFVATGEVKK